MYEVDGELIIILLYQILAEFPCIRVRLCLTFEAKISVFKRG